MTDTAPDATPRPWFQSHRCRSDGMYSTEIYDARGETIATVAWYPVSLGEGVAGTARDANAALIVEAVNAYDALRLENERLRKELEAEKKRAEAYREAGIDCILQGEWYKNRTDAERFFDVKAQRIMEGK